MVDKTLLYLLILCPHQCHTIAIQNIFCHYITAPPDNIYQDLSESIVPLKTNPGAIQSGQ